MKTHGEGRIVNVTSIGGKVSVPHPTVALKPRQCLLATAFGIRFGSSALK